MYVMIATWKNFFTGRDPLSFQEFGTVDGGRNSGPAICTTCYFENPMKNVIFSISAGGGFLPSTVCLGQAILTINMSCCVAIDQYAEHVETCGFWMDVDFRFLRWWGW